MSSTGAHGRWVSSTAARISGSVTTAVTARWSRPRRFTGRACSDRKLARTAMRRFSNQLTHWMAAWWPVLVVSFPIMFAAVRAAAGGWVPTGDDAYFTVRARDVLTEHHPLLGAWSSGSLDLITPINNLGPLQLDLLAPFTRFTPMGGTAIGVALINIAAIVAIAWLVARVAGGRAGLPAMCAVG